jgi:protein-disulfide isomerase
VAHPASRPVSYPRKRRAEKRPRSRESLSLVAVAGAVLVAIVLIVASQLGNRKSTAAPVTASVAGGADTAALFAGIPQRGTVLGSPAAPVTLVEYADLQCPYCGDFSRNVLPSLVRDYVRTGKVKVVFRGLAFVGPDSESALRAALAAKNQNRLWNFVDLLYANQGAENSGWVTGGLIRSVAGEIPGVDVTRLVADAQSTAVTGAIAATQRLASNDGVNSTPSFWIGRTGGALVALDVRSLEAAAFRPALDSLSKK